MRLTSQLINGISRVLQKLLKEFSLNFFNGTTILKSFVLPSAGVFPIIFISDLNDLESVKLSFGLSL